MKRERIQTDSLNATSKSSTKQTVGHIADNDTDIIADSLSIGSGLNRAQREVLRLQQTRGNQFVSRQLAGHAQRLTAEEKTQNLKSPRFAGNPRLEKAYDNDPPMSQGESDPAGGETTGPVAILQSALIDDGADMPLSTKKTGSPDGVFGGETLTAVCQFQTKYGLLEKGIADGLVGRDTLGKLDDLNLGPAPKKHPKSRPTRKKWAIGL